MVSAAGGWRLLESAQPDDLRMQIRGALGFWPVSASQRHSSMSQRIYAPRR
ncbi:hypothetical protein SAMN04489712_12817 [Thermomonospora echinospora]|uniref:Uncharacterized protein n=1 Tax=Thermomonospora echinospora TaxID=1992 RepID=A0A1H6E1I0_9ACTN|nr:hypothetical protein SAMN04489712_12817 [Thermomonospora echinospora]